MKRLSICVLLVALTALPWVATNGLAKSQLSFPSGRVILEISGAIEHTTDGTAALFDLPMLHEMPVTAFQTSTPWTDGQVAFEGVSISDLMAVVGAKGETLNVTALNDYTAKIPLSQLRDAGAILAYAMNGARLSVRDKGPLWVVFPFDKDPAYQTDVYWSNSIWQVKMMVVE